MLTLMMDVCMAILSRAMPRFQIFFVALPLKLYVGIFSLGVTLQLCQALFTTVFAHFQEYPVDLLATMR